MSEQTQYSPPPPTRNAVGGPTACTISSGPHAKCCWSIRARTWTWAAAIDRPAAVGGGSPARGAPLTACVRKGADAPPFTVPGHES